MSAIVVSLLEYALEMAVRILGEAGARQVTTERMEIVAARVAADAAHAALTGETPPP